MSVVKVSYFSDVLCIWAYIAQARIDAVREKFGDAVRLDQRFCSVFGNTPFKIPSTWRDKGEYAGFNAHLRNVALQFPHVEVHPDIWLKTRPPSSTSAHLFMTAVQQWQHEREGGGQANRARSSTRCCGHSGVRFFGIAATSRVGMFNANWPRR